MTAFELLAQPIQRALWNMRWTDLRPIQEQAIPIILQTERDLIISARTAAGKTEAAFLPVLSAIHDDPLASVRAIYVGPLKALINDQFRRLEDLAQLAEIPVHRWHGDVSGDRKRSTLEQPSGVLLITPESLEALFVNRGSQLPTVFHKLSFVVLDELHAMLGTERGLHLRSLLFRLQRLANSRIRLIALSATLGDLPKSAAWLRPDAPDQVEILTDAATQKSVQFRIHAYLMRKTPAQQRQQVEPGTMSENVSDVPASDLDHAPNQSTTTTDSSQQNLPPTSSRIPGEMLDDMFEYFRGQKNLIFANSKALVETCAEGLNQLCLKTSSRAEFLVHHGSLARETREETERLMQGKVPYTAVCSSTLELGIDIGNVTAVGQIGAPNSVNSMVQRLGRSGRKDGEPHCMRIFVTANEASLEQPVHEQLYLDLIQSIAVTELMLQKWFEPPLSDQGDFSTLTQQILSILAETGGIKATELFDRLVTRGAFHSLERSTFADLLRSLGSHDLIEQMSEGDLILGLKGQKIVSQYDFYSAFASAIEFRVTHGANLIGMLPTSNVPPTGENLMLGGRGWQVVHLDRHRREVSVVPASGRMTPFFLPTDRPVHARVRQQMREILSNSQDFPYLTERASQMLRDARTAAERSHVLSGKFQDVTNSKCVWFPWTGTKAIKTVEAMANVAGISVKTIDQPVIALEFSIPAIEVRNRMRIVLNTPVDVIKLAEQLEPKMNRKYDPYLTPELLNLGLSFSSLDLDNALTALQLA